MPMRMLKLLLVSAMMLSMPSCAPTVAPLVSKCPSWLKLKQNDPGFEARHTRNEKEQDATLNRNIKEFCR